MAVEAESSAIGRLKLPARLWKAMGAAPRLEIRAPRSERARYLARAYGDVAADPARLLATIERLRPFHAAARIAEWQALAGAGAFEALAEGLMEAHYDPRYARHRARMGVPVTPVPAPGLGPGDLPGLAARVAAAIQDPGSASGERS